MEEVPAFNVDSLLPKFKVVIDKVPLVEVFLIVLPFKMAVLMLVVPLKESVFSLATVS